MSTGVLKDSAQNFAAFQRNRGCLAFDVFSAFCRRHFLPDTGRCGNRGSFHCRQNSCDTLLAIGGDPGYPWRFTPEPLISSAPVPFSTREILIDLSTALINGRIDRCVQQLAGGSRSHVTGLFDHDCVSLNGQVEKNPGRTLNVGDQVQVRYEDNRRYSPRRRPEKQLHRGFSIVFEDRHVVVVEKSADLLTVPTDGREPHTLLYRVNEHVKHEGRGRGAFVVHRLDRGVSGLLMFGKTKEDARLMQNQFRQRKPERQYDALVAGIVAQDSGEFRSYLATGKNLTRYSTDDEEDGQLAVTHYQVAERLPDTTHVTVQLETGRRNQIRVHFAEAQHPVLGDNRYRSDLWKEIPWAHKRFALHASTLGFTHPVTGEPMRFSSTLPAEITNFMRFSKRLDKVLQQDLRVPRSDASKARAKNRKKMHR